MGYDRAVVVAFDENYLMPGLVAARTALVHSPDDVILVILAVDLSEEAKKGIYKTISSDRLMVVDAGGFVEGKRDREYVSSATWARIGIGSLLPPDVRRVVYVDADTLTRMDLTPLFNQPLDGKLLAACVDQPMPTHRARHLWGQTSHPDFDYGAECPVPEVMSYFNAGVLAIDLGRWRETAVESRVVDFVSSLPRSYLMLDQDVLNTLFWDDWLPIDWKLWNWPGFFKDSRAWESHIVHFISSPKPWVAYPMGAPFAREYAKAAAEVSWYPKPRRQRIKSGLIETVLPHSIVVRRKRISQSVRSRFSN